MSDTCTPPRTRLVDGVEVPATGRWLIDPGHADVGFVGRHLVFTKVRGRFRGVRGFVDIAADPEVSVVEVDIDMASVDSGDPTRDEHLRSADLFDVQQFPVATFRGRAMRWFGTAGRVAGELMIKGVTRPVELDVGYLGSVADPWGGERATFSASASVNREDWGISWNVPLAGGGLLVSKEIQLELELETIRQQ
jgi:polyisoprenoid-binding protein YceI